ncbi:MAG: replication and repair protein RecF, partial [Solirubrobacteraceae bacterium]|nr:replication and repair protein RecF [Solirubrobacteraceae bacterium]
GCTARSCRTSNEREVVRFETRLARVELDAEDRDGQHRITVVIEPGAPKRIKVDDAVVERLVDAPHRPLAAVFAPDRLELVKGPPSLRRAHLDQLVTALWPARASTRRAYGQALAQRNALLARVRAGRASRDSLGAWDMELARHGIALRDDRAAAAAQLTERFPGLADELGLVGGARLDYRPATTAQTAEELAGELSERLTGDLDRGFTGHGPHRDDVALGRSGRSLRSYASQGEQRLGLLALLLAEREVIGEARGHPPLMLLDDVMSELDGERRSRLAARLADGQSVISTTDLDQVPGALDPAVTRIAVSGGAVVQEALAA